MENRIREARPHVNRNEKLIFERSTPGKSGVDLPPLDVPPVSPEEVLGPEFSRGEVEGFPEVSELEVIRHFTRLSTWNYGVDTGLYPLGSCTMKYNPRINEEVARLEGLATDHPYAPEALVQGCLEVLHETARCLQGNNRHGRGHASARGGRARRTDRHPDDPRLPDRTRQPAEVHPDPRFGARNESRQRHHFRLRGSEHQVR